ncbi:calcium-transporting ATPase 4, endoplasmic reticulum-type-like [Telopea speciosissima]|uniref:calcium-transporting ATPase 4, endoplasmic reticulum-type-like n=1 Tax=Telopea speciosissima TaxID=54955 RepID=UPI001CC75297|nr:calcium-transporting ATPase 4, endoplasmic reticulum-type-like [Telopea speciosissima]
MGKGGEDYGKRDDSGSRSPDKEIFPAWAKDVDQCLKEYKVDKDVGLTSARVAEQRQTYGLNELEEHGVLPSGLSFSNSSTTPLCGFYSPLPLFPSSSLGTMGMTGPRWKLRRSSSLL